MLNPNSRSTITLTWFKTVTKLHAGQSFGELALLKNDGRAATILCATKCSFATLHRKDYIWIIGQEEKRKLKQIVEFLRGFRIFSSLRSNIIEKIY